ncbi:MAG: FAD-binding oxidoreductase [Aquificaceae bacterium]|nr:FAD-binding oxidoreductase [Aquificaceae bacterium]MDW8095587.1 FAD-binding oxidoreductase [Aquificaceae bacterium]
MDRMVISGWGRNVKIEANVYTLTDEKQAKRELLKLNHYIPFGKGRSYGDSALSENIVYTPSYNHILEFDEKNGFIRCQSGITIGALINFLVPRGWFLWVTPGTKHVTIGGAIASDVHGKNHHKDGSFCQFVEEIKLMLPDGNIVVVKKGEELFRATCGGIGLTGVILEAKLKLKKVYSKNILQTTVKTEKLEETIEFFEKFKDVPYSVAWVDCIKSGRSLISMGDFAKDGDLAYKPSRKIKIPFELPSFILNRTSISLFNYFYYNKVKWKQEFKKVSLEEFFYPLDGIENWNFFYGRRGLIQYQFILPKSESYHGLAEVMEEVNKSGVYPTLCVLKLYGEQNGNYLSFPMEGYSLAMDFWVEDKVFSLLSRLDRIVLKYGGRLYLAKDSVMNKEVFEAGYPMVEKFREIRRQIDPERRLRSLQSLRLAL